MNTWTKLKSGDWGVRGSAATIKAGATVTVTKRSGETKRVTIGRVLWTGNGIAIATVGGSAGTTRNSAPRRSRAGSGRGQAAYVPGYSRYCTDSVDCGCFDCF